MLEFGCVVRTGVLGLTPSGLVARTGRGSLVRTFGTVVLTLPSLFRTEPGLFLTGFVSPLTPDSGLVFLTGLLLSR